MSTEAPKVLIIGAGVGGLTLAQALRQKGVPFEIFERDAAADARPQGWGITLHQCVSHTSPLPRRESYLRAELPISLLSHLADTRALSPRMLKDLAASLPDDLPDMRTLDATGGELRARGRYYDLRSGALRSSVERATDGTPILRGDRGKLRPWLESGLDIRWGKSFERVEHDGDGVVACFADGTRAGGAVLVGADGVNSHGERSSLWSGHDNSLPPRRRRPCAGRIPRVQSIADAAHPQSARSSPAPPARSRRPSRCPTSGPCRRSPARPSTPPSSTARRGTWRPTTLRRRSAPSASSAASRT